MKILKRPETNWSFKYTCQQCTAELEIEKTDVEYIHYDGDMREPSYDSWTAQCPLCMGLIYIPVAQIPKAVQIEIKTGKFDTLNNITDLVRL